MKLHISVIVLFSLALFSSCSKTQSEGINTNHYNNPNLKTEFISIEESDWQSLGNDYYKYEYESSLLDNYKTIDSIELFTQRLNQNTADDGNWKKLPCNNFSFNQSGKKIIIYSNNKSAVYSNIFRIEIKISEESIQTFEDRKEKSTFDDFIKAYNNLQKTNTVLLKVYDYYNQGSKVYE